MADRITETDYLDFPEPHSSYPAVYALGRMTAAWGELEHCFFALLLSLSASISDPLPSKESRTGLGRDVDIFFCEGCLLFTG